MKRFMGVVACAALLTLTCTSGEIIINGIEEPPAATSPAKCLKCVEISFNECDVNLLKGMLSPNLVFYLDPDEPGRYPGGGFNAPQSYTEFWRAAHNMFERAYSVAMFIDSGNVGAPDPEQATYRADYINIKLLVMVTEASGFLAEGCADFEFEKYRNDAGEDRWRIIKWWDRTLTEEGEGGSAEPTAGVQRTSFAAILAYYQ